MLGNVAEMMFEPFRLNKLDRSRTSGGFIVRGGSYLTLKAICAVHGVKKNLITQNTVQIKTNIQVFV